MSQMYGKKRIVMKAANTRGHQMVVQCGGTGIDGGRRGGSYNPLGVWYQKDGLFYADLKSEEQEYKTLMVVELGVKAFGGFNTKAELRTAISTRRGF